jgi:hypothetical protein
MKKIIQPFLFVLTLIVISCSNDIQDIEMTKKAKSFEILSPLSYDKVLDGTKLLNNATTFVWDDNESGTFTYTLEAAKSGTNFANPIVVGTTNNQSFAITIGTLDNTAKAVGIEPLTNGLLEFRVKTGTRVTKSVIFSVTPYQPNWGVIGSATTGGWNASTEMIYNPSTSKYTYTGWFSNGEYKFRLDYSWTTNLGDNDNNLSLEYGGANIPITAGYYTIVLNVQNLSYTVTPITNRWGIIGSATPKGWDNDTLMDYNATTNKFSTVIKMKPGAFKFRVNEDWGNSYGAGSSNLTLSNTGGDIPFTTTGKYFIEVNPSTLTYTITNL